MDIYPNEVEINENILKILQSSFILERPINPLKNYIVQMEIEIAGVEQKDNKNGTVDVIFKGRGKNVLAIKTDKKPVVAVKKNQFTPAQLTRFAIQAYYDQHYGEPDYEFIPNDSELFYEMVLKKFRGNLENVIRLLFTKP